MRSKSEIGKGIELSKHVVGEDLTRLQTLARELQRNIRAGDTLAAAAAAEKLSKVAQDVRDAALLVAHDTHSFAEIGDAVQLSKQAVFYRVDQFMARRLEDAEGQVTLLAR